MATRKKKGSILIVTLFILFFLSVLSLSMGYSLRLKINMLERRKERLLTFYILRGALNMVIEELEKEREGSAFDSFGGEIFSKYKGPLYFYGPQGDIKGSYRVYVTDEEARLNINTASKESLLKFLGNFDVDNKRLSEAICSYRESKKDRLFYTPYELLRVEGIRKEIFYGDDLNEDGILQEWEDTNKDQKLDRGIKDFITVYGDGKVNVNSASLEVLESMRGSSLKIAKEIIDKRPFKSMEELKDKLSLSEEELNNILRWAKVKSDYFKVVITTRRNKTFREIVAILDISSFEIVYFRSL